MDTNLDKPINALSLIQQLEDWILGLKEGLTKVTLEDGGIELYRSQGRIEALTNVIGAVITIVEESNESQRTYT